MYVSVVAVKGRCIRHVGTGRHSVRRGDEVQESDGQGADQRKWRRFLLTKMSMKINQFY